MRTTTLFIHVLAAAVWFGANVTRAFLAPRLARGGGSAAASYYRATVAMGTRIYTPAAVVSLLTGIGLLTIGETPYTFGSAFVTIGFLMVIIGAVLGVRVFGPKGEMAASLAETGDNAGAAGVGAKLAMAGRLETVLLLLTVAAMVWKLGE